MNSHNLLSEIAGYLDLKSFIQFSSVSKLFNRVSQSDHLWIFHFYSTFFGDLSIFGEVSKTNKKSTNHSKLSFKSLCKKRGHLKQMWKDVGKDISSSSDQMTFIEDFFQSLKEPMLPIPVLRRDGFCFETIFQDLVGNFENDLDNGDFDENVPFLEQVLKVSENSPFACMDSCQLHQLTVSRWLLKDLKKETPCRDSTASQSTSAEFEGRNTLIDLMELFRKTVKVHCKAVCLCLDPDLNEREFLVSFSALWEAFTSSMHRLQALMSPLNQLVNQTYDQKSHFSIRVPVYSSIRVMAIEWQRNVHPAHGDFVVESLLKMIESCREAFPSSPSQDDLILIKKTVDSLVDLSVHELSIHFVRHSEFQMTGLLSQFSSKLLLSTSCFYTQLKSKSIFQIIQGLDQDLDLLSSFCLSSLLAPLKKMNLELRVESISSHFLPIFLNFQQIPFELILTQPSSELSSSHFAKFLFKSSPCLSIKSKIQQFLIFIQDSKEIDLVHKFNSAKEDLDLDLNYPDCEISYKTQKLMKASPEEEKLFSFCSSLDYEEFLMISANFSMM